MAETSTLVVVRSAGAARQDVRHDREGHSDKGSPGEPEGVSVVDADTVVTVVDAVLGLDVDGGQESGAYTESEGREQSDESSAEECEAVREQTSDPCNESQAGTNKDQVHGRLGEVAEVLGVAEGGLRQKVLDVLARILRSIGEDGINGEELETKASLRAGSVAAGDDTTAVVVETPLVVVLETVALTNGRVLVLGVQVVDRLTVVRESVTETSSVNRNVANVARDNVVGELTNVCENAKDHGGKGEELAYVDDKSAERVEKVFCIRPSIDGNRLVRCHVAVVLAGLFEAAAPTRKRRRKKPATSQHDLIAMYIWKVMAVQGAVRAWLFPSGSSRIDRSGLSTPDSMS